MDRAKATSTNAFSGKVCAVTSAEDFDRWYADRATSPLADDLVRRTLGLPPGLESTSLLGGQGLDEVVPALRLAAGRVLLDLACGRGGYGLEIARRTGCRLVGVDFSAVVVDQARKASDGGDFRVGTLTATGLSTASVDAVLVVDSVQFAESKPDALRECLRVLRPGGRLVITCWQAAEPADERVWRRIRELDLARQLPEAGFADVEVVDRPEWREQEKRMWEEALATDAPGDPAMASMRKEARSVLETFDRKRRVLATATRPR
ncbi:methyltransferase family protein [Lentzea flaviverrucosa]|uniref:Methyltransferase domain-containing protein n=1 Tax=Lentzea flaviverrucosa TaxID=200379 RepID=A0A1H9XYT6_9PSEU|nr:methyltransferase family protein [Lentzea flaviverrucosa]SES50843.1 Methyltransferase domain-containing protein [Lentzea flaviverrucosa]